MDKICYNKMARVLLWGSGSIYNQHLNVIKYMEDSGGFRVVGIVATLPAGVRKLDGYPVYSKAEVAESAYDYILVMSEQSYHEIIEEAVRLGIPREKLLSYRILEIPGLRFGQYIRLKESRISIVSNNCWGGILYRTLGMECLSPFKNLFLEDGDYLKLLEDLPRYLSRPLKFIHYGTDRHSGEKYPVMRLDDISVHCNHEKTPEAAAENWNRRLGKMNLNHLFIEMYTADRAIAEKFVLLTQYKRKICFVPFESTSKDMMQLKLAPGQSEFYEAVNGSAARGGLAYSLVDLLTGEIKARME